MAIESFGLATSSTGVAGSSIRVTASSTPSGVWLRWHTLTGVGTIKAFDLAVAYQRVQTAAKGASEPQYGGWSDWFYEQVPVAQCAPVADSTGYSWSHTLNLASLYSKMIPHGLAYSTRDNDEVHLQLKVKAVYEQSYIDATGQSVSDVVYSEAWIGWIPTYSVSAASFGASGDLTLTFSRPGWTRTDDRYTFTAMSQSGQTLLGKASGKVGGGTVKITAKQLRRLARAGAMSYTVRIEAAYKASGYALTTASGTVQVVDNSTSSTVRIALTVDGTGVRVATSDSGDKTLRSTRATVKIRGLSEDYDTAEVTVGQAVTLRFPPLDKTLTVDCVGTASDAHSAMSSATVTVPSNGRTYLHARDDSQKAFSLKYGAQWKSRIDRDVDTVKLAGRRRESAFFGTGAEVSATLTGSLIDIDGVEQGLPDIAEEVAATAGVLVVRRPGGSRGEYALEKMQATYDCVSPVVKVTASLTEVV